MHDDANHEELPRQVRLRAQRHRRWLGEGDASLARRLAQIGVLGWIIVLPTLVGLFAGRWLDRLLHTGLLFSAALLFAGVLLGMRAAWSWMSRER